MVFNTRRASFAFLCMVPFLDIVLVGARTLRTAGVHLPIGGAFFALMCIATWMLGGPMIRAGEERRRLLLAAALLFVPFAFVSLLWVGIATPWDATPSENRMRYLVLLAGSIAVTGGFVVLEKALYEAHERIYSTLGFVAGILAGAAYLIWTTFQVAAYAEMVRKGESPSWIVSLNDVLDTLLFVACVLTYLATGAFASALGKANWLGRGAARAYVGLNVVALLFIVSRGLSFPDPTAGSTPAYALPGFIAGIPAVPWIMPFLLGVVLLRRASDEQR